jgi:hypothetical protein
MGKPTDLVQGTLDLLILKTLSLEVPPRGRVRRSVSIVVVAGMPGPSRCGALDGIS